MPIYFSQRQIRLKSDSRCATRSFLKLANPTPQTKSCRAKGWLDEALRPTLSLSLFLQSDIYVYICIVKYINIHIGGLMEYISQKVAAYGQFVLVYTSSTSLTRVQTVSCIHVVPHLGKVTIQMSSSL